MSEFFKKPKENSEVKATIVTKYFDVWSKIIQNEKIAYVDLYCGPGKYDDGTPSTPLRVLERAIANENVRARLLSYFNDEDADHVAALKEAIAALPNVSTLKYAPDVSNEQVGEKIAEQLEGMNKIPVFCFVDPFGYKGLSLRLVNAIVKDWACECMFFFNYNRINPGISNGVVEEHMNALFGKERADALRKQLPGLAPELREAKIVDAILEALQEPGGRYVLRFRFLNPEGTRTSHHLIFVTKHAKGHQVMKQIMAGESSRHEQGVASFDFCQDEAKRPRSLFDIKKPLDTLEAELLVRYAGRTTTMDAIYDDHNVGTPYIEKNYKDALTNLEAAKKITCNPPASGRPKRKGAITFGGKTLVKFPK